MLIVELIQCRRCGSEVRRKRLAQRYCSERCRNASVQSRRRRKQAARSGDNRDRRGRPGLEKRRLVPPYLEAVTGPQKKQGISDAYGGKKSGLYPWASVQPPVVDLIGIEPELLAEIVRVETAD
jgi:endogenous inhibitor of DNA gyrase (YacG/DUF329 family)